MEEATKTIFRCQKTYGQLVIDLTDSRKQIPKTECESKKPTQFTFRALKKKQNWQHSVTKRKLKTE